MREINRLSVQQWLRSAISDSQQPISPIGFLFLKLPPPPCAVLLVIIIKAQNVPLFVKLGKRFDQTVVNIAMTKPCNSRVQGSQKPILHVLGVANGWDPQPPPCAHDGDGSTIFGMNLKTVNQRCSQPPSHVVGFPRFGFGTHGSYRDTVVIYNINININISINLCIYIYIFIYLLI